MAFPVDLTSVLTGATVWQLRRWRATGLLVPETQSARPPLYSFRDIVALRTVARLRAETSLQKIRAAFARLPEYDLTDHVSQYRFATHGKSIAVWTDDRWLDLVAQPGQYELRTLRDIYAPFTTNRGVEVVDFQHPRPHLEVDARRLGGWPVLEGTRINYDVAARAVDNVTIFPKDVQRFYPGATEAAVDDALDFADQVNSVAA